MKIKNLLLVAASGALLTGCFSTPENPDEPKEPQKTYLLSKSSSYYKQKRDDDWARSYFYEYLYDENGHVIEEKQIFFYEDEEFVANKNITEYDELGNETKYETFTYDYETKQVGYRKTITYENYDSFGNCGKETEIYYEEPSFVEVSDTVVTICEFDANGRKTKETEISELSNEIVTYDYDDNGNLKTKYFVEVQEGVANPYKKIEYSYYENTAYQKDIETYYYEYEGYEDSPADKHHFEYDENGLMTLYAIYEDGVLASSLEWEITSNVSIKETMKNDMPDIGFTVCSVTERVYLNHDYLLNEDYSGLVSETEYLYDFSESETPTSKTVITYTHENGLVTEMIEEQIYYENNSDVEFSYSAFKEVNEYIEF